MPNWTPEQMLKHPKFESLVGVNTKTQKQATEKSKVTPEIYVPSNTGELTFVVIGPPMGKPRMTQRDKWKTRACVLRYRDYCDRIREAMPTRIRTIDVYGIDVVAYLPMPKSWSKKKQTAQAGKMCRTKPDWDNIGKAVCDALFEEDSMIADGRTRKFWCRHGEQRTEIKLMYHAQ